MTAAQGGVESDYGLDLLLEPSVGAGSDSESQVQFIHPEKLLAAHDLPGARQLPAEVLAAIYGASIDEIRAVRGGFVARVRAAALELLADQVVVQQMDRLPFEDSAVVVALGDSLTDDLQSWFEILRQLLAARQRGDVRLVNAGVSGDTTSAALARVEPILRVNPDWLLVCLGVNDARRHGLREAPMLVSDSETEANLAKLHSLVTARTDAELVWMTPPPIDPAAILEHEPFRVSAVSWEPDDVARKAKIVCGREGRVVDLYGAASRSGASVLLPDGLHLGIEGHKLLTRCLLNCLSPA